VNLHCIFIEAEQYTIWFSKNVPYSIFFISLPEKLLRLTIGILAEKGDMKEVGIAIAIS
jgi:hypothetical protein